MVYYSEYKSEIIEAIKKVSPGTLLREGIDNILSARTGALIVIGDNKNVLKVVNGGFELHSDFTPQRLFELAKMDGAIILDENLDKILMTNVHLVPDPKMHSNETGMRHQAADRVARQTKAMVISISQKRDIVTIYVGNHKYVLEDIEVLLAKANQALQALEKYKNSLEQVSSNLSALEFEDLVTLIDVATFIQRSAMMERVSGEIKKYIFELGLAGRLIELQLEELMGNVENDCLMSIYDYSIYPRKPEKINDDINRFDSEEILDLLNITQALGFKGDIDLIEKSVSSRGYRLLMKIPHLPFMVVRKIVKKFGNLQNIINATQEQLDEVDGVGSIRAKAIQEGLQKLKEYSIIERYT